mgnify:FL=1
MDIGRYAPAQRLDLQINEFGGLNLSTDFLRLMAHNIEQSVRQNDPRLLERVVDLLVESRRKLIIGVQGSKSCAMQFSRLLGFLLERVELLSTGESDEIAMLSGLGPEDTIVAVSYARYYKTDAYLAQLVHRTGANIVVLADSTKSPWAQIADVLLLVETRHMGSFNSTLGTTCLLYTSPSPRDA